VAGGRTNNRRAANADQPGTTLLPSPTDAACSGRSVMAPAAEGDSGDCLRCRCSGFIWPGITLVTLVLLFGAFALIDGAIALGAEFSGSAKPVPAWWLILVGLLGIAAGFVTFL
jgi:hypothetical protein